MVYNFGPRLIALRKQRGWSQNALAQRIGKSDSAIGTYENDAAVPSLETASALADVFGVSMDYLLEGEKCETLSLKGLNEKQVQLLTELARELASPSGSGPAISDIQKELLSRIIEEFVR